jgi:hypothetical protein
MEQTMKIRNLTAAAALGILCSPSSLLAQDERPAITARVHGTFVDQRGGAGVLSGDMRLERFEIQNGSVTAIGRIDGALADSTGKVLGLVEQELVLPVSNVDSTCNQLRMDLAAADADVLQTRVHFDRETAGFDSRDGATPKALGVLCAAGELLRKKPSAADLAKALNDVVATLNARRSDR